MNKHQTMAKKSQSHHLFFLSNPEIGNLIPTVRFAERLFDHDHRFTATLLIISIPQRPVVNSFLQSLPATSPNIRLLRLPPVDSPSPDQLRSASELSHISNLIASHKPNVKRAIETATNSAESDSDDSARVAGLFVDMFCTSMIDVAAELGVACYLFFASPATFLGFMLYLPSHLDPRLTPDSGDTEFDVPSFANSVPRRVLPTTVLKRRDGYSWYLHHARRYTKTKGIVVNSFRELEPYALDSLCKSGWPAVYPIGPVIDVNGPGRWHPDRAQFKRVIEWLDRQPKDSVVFLCFGSMRSFSEPQVKEVAHGLERAGFRFLWSVRDPPKAKLGIPSDYSNLETVLPSGFLDRTVEIGLVCGWVPQVEILSHQAVGGFVSHCGWNSILESLWHGVPIATWPIFAEQQMNAFEMVVELGLAVEIRLDYRELGSDLVLAKEVEKGVKRLMSDNEVRAKVKGMREKCRTALMESGSSHKSLKALVEELTSNI